MGERQRVRESRTRKSGGKSCTIRDKASETEREERERESGTMRGRVVQWFELLLPAVCFLFAALGFLAVLLFLHFFLLLGFLFLLVACTFLRFFLLGGMPSITTRIIWIVIFTILLLLWILW